MKQKKAMAYRESQEGKVSQLLRRLESNLKLTGKIERIQQKVEKLKQSLTTSPSQAYNIKETIAQYEAAIGNYEEEMKIHNFTSEERNSNLERIRIIIASIEPLPAYQENEKQIHKNLKNLNRFEEHLLILKTRSQNEQFIVEASKIISQVVEKKQSIITMIDNVEDAWTHKNNQFQQIKQDTDDSFAETPTIQPENYQPSHEGVKNLLKSSPLLQQPIQYIKELQQSERDLDLNETPTAEGEENKPEIKQISLLQDSQIEKKDDLSGDCCTVNFHPADLETKDLVKVVEQICEMEKCQICFAKKRRFVAIPCGHYIYCDDCKELVLQKMRCLLCRQNVCQMFEVFA